MRWAGDRDKTLAEAKMLEKALLEKALDNY